jgi:hypothetical protein
VAKGVGLHESRTRVVFHLPLGDFAEEQAANKILKFLKSKRRQASGVKGFTHSIFRPAVFRGWWWSHDAKNWCDDPIVIVMVDFMIDFSDLKLSQKIKVMKGVIRQWYRHYGKPQEEIWVVAHQVMRFD